MHSDPMEKSYSIRFSTVVLPWWLALASLFEMWSELAEAKSDSSCQKMLSQDLMKISIVRELDT